MMSAEEEAVRYAQEHAGDLFEEIPAAVRPRVRDLVVQELQSSGGTSRTLRSKLFDEFAPLNLDWDLVAATVRAEARLQGFIASQPVSTRVRWMAARTGACAICRTLDGQVFTVVAADSPNKDWFREVWAGKSRLRASAAAPSPPGDWPAAGVQHAGCRCCWTFAPQQPTPPGVSPEFAAWLDDLIARARPGT